MCVCVGMSMYVCRGVVSFGPKNKGDSAQGCVSGNLHAHKCPKTHLYTQCTHSNRRRLYIAQIDPYRQTHTHSEAACR